MSYIRRLVVSITALLLAAGLAVVVAPTSNAAAAPTTPTNLRVTAKTDHTVSIAWNASSGGSGQLLYRLYLNDGWVGRIDGTTLTQFGLTRNTAYTFQVQAEDPAGNLSGRSNVATATTDVGDAQPPTAPPNLRVTQVTFDSVSLAWDASTDNSGQVDFYPVLINGQRANTSYTTTVILHSLVAGTTYTFGVQASDPDGNVSAASSVQVSTIADNQPPTTPANLRVVTDSSGAPTGLAWNPSTDNRKLGRYKVMADGRLVRSQVSTSMTFASLLDLFKINHGQTYRFTVLATDVTGNQSGLSNEVTATIP